MQERVYQEKKRSNSLILRSTNCDTMKGNLEPGAPFETRLHWFITYRVASLTVITARNAGIKKRAWLGRYIET
jgi:hypothetical protein